MHTSSFLGEFFGTLILILLGDGVVAGVLLKRSKAENAGWISITAAWAFAVTFGVFVSIACGGRDAFLNPAFTLGAAIASNDYSKLALYIPAQLLGAICGAILVWLHYLPHWKETDNADFKLGVFCTAPAIRNNFANLISEIIGTFVLVFVAVAMSAKAVGAMAPGIGPYLVGILVWAIGLSLGGTTGYAINPARDLGPRIAHAILPIPGKRDADWSYAPIPVVGPLIGASLAGALIRFLQL
jgi:glycerol uptake facilitator protein